MGVFVRRTALGCVLGLTMALAFGSVAQAAWFGAGPLGGARYNHTATVLNDGSVLVAGGYNSAPLAGAELYDAATNSWSGTGPLNVARSGHAAVRLQDGRVLVAGGGTVGGPSTYTPTAEVYDPSSRTWSRTGNMTEARYHPTMTLLVGGRVLVAGGAADNGAVSLASAEIYNPADGTWTPTAQPMHDARQDATATLLKDGKVLVAGGWDGTELSSAELFDPSGTGTWTKTTGDLAQPRDSATATALDSGDVLVAGGSTLVPGDGEGAKPTRFSIAGAEVYDADTGLWRTTQDMAVPRANAAATLLDDGTVLVAGGNDPAVSDALAGAEDYDPIADKWTDAGPMATARNLFTLTALTNGRAIAVGGNPAGFDIGLAGVERFSTASTALANTDFGGVLVGTTSGVADIVFTNTGKKPLTVTDVSITGASAASYAVVSNSCAGEVAAHAPCHIGVRFTPGAAGNRSATLNVTDDSTAAGSTTASLAGVGTTPAPPPGAAPAGGGGAAGGASAGAGAAGAAGTAVLGTHASSGSKAKPAKATCSTKTTRSHGRKRSTVTCSVTWPNGSGALTTRLMRGKKVVATTHATARAGKATLRLNTTSRLKSGSYTLVVTKGGGTVVLRQTIRVS